MLPNVDEINILDVDIAGPQNMYPEVKISRMKFWEFGTRQYLDVRLILQSGSVVQLEDELGLVAIFLM